MPIKGFILSSNAEDYSTLYNDKGSSADADVQFWKPDPPDGFLPCGDVCEASPSDWIYGSGAPRGQVIVVSDPTGSGLVVNPVSFTLVWTDTGSGATLNGSVWAMVPPAGYTALGHVCTFSTTGDPPMPDRTAYYCVASSLVATGQEGAQIWDDEGSGADANVGVWQVVPATPQQYVSLGTFMATTSHNPGTLAASVLPASSITF